MRFATPNARIMVHQPSGGFQGQASDIERHAQDIIKLKRRLNEIYVKHTGSDYETIEKTLDRDHFMTADEAKEFGLIDKVISSREAIEGRACRHEAAAGLRCADDDAFLRCACGISVTICCSLDASGRPTLSLC